MRNMITQNRFDRIMVCLCLVFLVGLPAAGCSDRTEKLILDLKNENADVRQRAAKALGEIGDARAIKPLKVAEKDKDAGVRFNAAISLGKIGNAKAAELTERFSNSTIENVKAPPKKTIKYNNIVSPYETISRCGICGAPAIGYCSIRQMYVCNTHSVVSSYTTGGVTYTRRCY